MKIKKLCSQSVGELCADSHFRTREVKKERKIFHIQFAKIFQLFQFFLAPCPSVYAEIFFI